MSVMNKAQWNCFTIHSNATGNHRINKLTMIDGGVAYTYKTYLL